MRICIIGSSKKFFSGISAYTIEAANAFVQHGHEVSVILLRNLVPLLLYPGRDRVGKGNYLVDFRNEVDVYDGMDWNSPVSWIGACRFLKKKEPEAVIIHWWTSSVAHMQALLVLSRYVNRVKTRYILEMHEVVDTLEEKILPIRLYSRIAGKSLIKLCDGYTAHSKEARQAIIRTYDIPSNKIHVVPHGPYNTYGIMRNENKFNKTEFNILHFGAIRQYKGIPVLIRAFNLLPEEIALNTRLIIAGEDWCDDPEIILTLNQSPYRERIVYRSEFIPDEVVPQYFAEADVVVLPYLRTYGSGVVNIALAQGKSIITSELSTMRECLADYKGATYFPVRDVTALRDLLLDAYEQWRAGGTCSYQCSSKTWEFIIQKYEQIIADLASQNGFAPVELNKSL